MFVKQISKYEVEVWTKLSLVDLRGIGHNFFASQKVATPSRLFFLSEKHSSGFRFPTQANQLACCRWTYGESNPALLHAMEA